MTDEAPVTDHANLEGEQFAALRSELCRHVSMERALAWFFARRPPLVPEDLVPQDEFSYDLLVPYPGGLYLSYDTS